MKMMKSMPNDNNLLLFMYHNPKIADNKLTTSSKLPLNNLNNRQKKLELATFALGNEIDLPPISSVLVRFPETNRERFDIKNSRKRKNIFQLDRILEGNTHKIKTDDINRIIFASPMKNRITFQRTFFRSSLYFTIDEMRTNNNHSYIKESGSQKIRRQLNESAFAKIKNQQQNQKIEQIKINWLSEPNTINQYTKSRYSNVLDSNPETILEKRKKQRNLRKVLESKLPHNKNRSNQIYSPWRNDDLEEELIL